MAGAKTLPKEPGLDDPRRTLLRRVAASESFAKSPRLRELLIYLTESALRNPSSALSEQQVGGSVCLPVSGFDPADASGTVNVVSRASFPFGCCNRALRLACLRKHAAP